jgi:hypothetical protein
MNGCSDAVVLPAAAISHPTESALCFIAFDCEFCGALGTNAKTEVIATQGNRSDSRARIDLTDLIEKPGR